MNLAYIAGAFRAPTSIGIEANVRRAMRWAATINLAGQGEWFAHCPHSACYDVWVQMIQPLTPERLTNEAIADLVNSNNQFWLAGDLLILEHAQLIVLTPGWFNSEGSRLEFSFAIQHRIEQLEVYPETQLDSLTIKLKEITNAIYLKRGPTSS